MSTTRSGSSGGVETVLQFLMRGDLPSPKDASVYALHPALLDPTRVRLLTASDLAAQLAPSAE